MNKIYNKHISAVSSACISCNVCISECAFLSRYGSPARIAELFEKGDFDAARAFECSLCGLCSAVCPVGLEPDKFFMELRTLCTDRKITSLKKFRPLLNYEKAGTSKLFSFTHIPEGSKTVFFPGCALPGTRPDTTFMLYDYLKEKEPLTGIILDCCMKPSLDLNRVEPFNVKMKSLVDLLEEKGVEQIVTACPNCYRVFSEHAETVKTSIIYDYLKEKDLPLPSACPNTSDPVMTIHDPCSIRYSDHIHGSVRELLTGTGVNFREMKHNRKNSLCCGEGGAVGFTAPESASTWKGKIKEEAGDEEIITYCAGCANSINKAAPAVHILDIIFNTKKYSLMHGNVSSPFTYINRLLLKRRLKKSI